MIRRGKLPGQSGVLHIYLGYVSAVGSSRDSQALVMIITVDLPYTVVHFSSGNLGPYPWNRRRRARTFLVDLTTDA